jgi:hypothetical protein
VEFRIPAGGGVGAQLRGLCFRKERGHAGDQDGPAIIGGWVGVRETRVSHDGKGSRSGDKSISLFSGRGAFLRIRGVLT